MTDRLDDYDIASLKAMKRHPNLGQHAIDRINAAIDRKREAARGERLPTERTLVIPFAKLCSVNRRTTPGNWRGVSKEWRAALAMARTAVEEQWGGLPPFTGPVAVVFDFYWPDARTRDLSNWVKLPEDALIDVAYVDDSQIVEAAHRDQGIDREHPRVEITVRIEGSD